MATYYASKAFVNNFTEALSYELRGTGVTATVSCPGPLTTEFFQAAAAHPPRLLIPMTAEAVARGAYRSMRAGRPLMIHGLMNWLVAAAGSLTPRIIIVAFLVKPPSTPALKA